MAHTAVQKRPAAKSGKPFQLRRFIPRKPLNRMFILLFLSLFQAVTFYQALTLTVTVEGVAYRNMDLFLYFALFLVLEWVYVLIGSFALKKKSFELEALGFFLTGIGLTMVASVHPDQFKTQYIATILGIAVFIGLTWFLGDINRVMKMRLPIAILALVLLAVNLIIGKEIHGARNWIKIGSLSFQPSELVKVAFVFVGAATLEKLQTTRSLTTYLIFAVGCIGALFIMKDLGAALIFFFTFLIIAFMRSGDIRTIILVCVAAALGALLIITFKSSYVMERLAAYRHIWEPDVMQGKGFQQTRVLIYAVSGGLFGVGIGNGYLRNIFASSSDLAFGVICEEWGILMALLIILIFAALTVYTVRCAPTSRSAFYSIASCAAAGMLLFQTCLNVFGVTDLLPLTGVTLPFISQGGTSIICVWGLFAFIKAADIRTYPKLYTEPEVVTK